MSRVLEKLRGTGRTTRMILEARRLALEGKWVHIVAASDKDCDKRGSDISQFPRF
jgi:hypothetical protein